MYKMGGGCLNGLDWGLNVLDGGLNVLHGGKGPKCTK